MPSDIIAGLLLIRENQQLVKSQINNLDFFSGVEITPSTKFYDLTEQRKLEEFNELLYYANYAAASYGW